MRYAGSMTPGLRLNTAAAHAWAAVVSGTAWKVHTLAPAGVLTAEYTRGPLILWATRPGEVVQADGPAVSPLEDRIDRLNTAQVFERFKWAARGKVRPSVRWKSSSAARRCQTALVFLFEDAASIYVPHITLEGEVENKLAVVTEIICDFTHPAWRYLPVRLVRLAMSRRSFVEIKKTTKAWNDSLAWWDRPVKVLAELENITYGEEETAVRDAFFERIWQCQLQGENPGLEDVKYALKIGGDVFTAVRLLGYCEYGIYTKIDRDVWRVIHELRNTSPLRRLRSLKAFEAAAYRAHVTRRVKPAPRRGRIRRPLYARPRPPSCPLAPPVS